MAKIQLTEEGFEVLNKEYERLINEDRPRNLEALKEARAQGDLSENAEYDAARDEQSKIEGRIKEIENTFKNCNVIITDENYKKVQEEFNRLSEPSLRKKQLEIIISNHIIKDLSSNLGKMITIYFEDTKETEKYIIVGSLESDPLNGKISNESPIGEKVLKASVGDRILINTDNDKFYIQVKKIEDANQ